MSVKYIVISFAIFVIVAVVCWNLAPGWITAEISKVMGVEFSIGHFGVGFDSVSARNIRIANPEGYTFRDALRVEKLEADTNIFHLFRKDIVIDRFEGMTKELSKGIIISETTFAAVQELTTFENLGPTLLAGRDTPITLYSTILS